MLLKSFRVMLKALLSQPAFRHRAFQQFRIHLRCSLSTGGDHDACFAQSLSTIHGLKAARGSRSRAPGTGNL